MKKIFFITVGIFVYLVAAAQSKKFILQNINVVDVLNKRIIPHQAVVIREQRIENIRPVSGFSASKNDSIINGRQTAGSAPFEFSESISTSPAVQHFCEFHSIFPIRESVVIFAPCYKQRRRILEL